MLYPAKGREAPWNPTCFQQGPLAPLRGIYRTTLGLMANLRGPFPPRWALTAGLLTTESLDHSSTVSTARLAFRRPRHCSFFLFAPVQECARSSCFTLLRISFLSTEISSRGGDAWKEERWTEIGVCEYGENFRILWIDKWIKVNRCLWFFFFIVFCCCCGLGLSKCFFILIERVILENIFTKERIYLCIVNKYMKYCCCWFIGFLVIFFRTSVGIGFLWFLKDF